ncbi:MAG: Endoribonuclease [Verrucomicrobiales bacterium]|nr:Endoribonuclease [Verrucomicrobiales bacterium]
MKTPIQAIYGPGVIKSSLPFSPAIRAGDFVFVSGMASADENGQLIPDTFANEAHRTYENIRRVLDAAGLDFSRVVQVRCYLAKQENWDEHNRIYREYFSEPFPARTTLIGCLGDLVKYEVDVVAYAGS